MGIDRFVVATNDFLATYRKDGVQLDARWWKDLFGSVVTPREGFTAPSIVYDPMTSRFFVAVMGGRFDRTGCVVGECRSAYYIAVSKTASPTSASDRDWFVYALDATVERSGPIATRRAAFIDDPVIAVFHDRVIVSGAVMRFADESFVHFTELRSIPLAPLLVGNNPVEWHDYVDWTLADGHQIARVQPAVMLGDAPVLYLVSHGGGCGFVVWSLDIARPDAVPVGRAFDVPVAERCGPAGGGSPGAVSPARQPGSALPIDPGDGRAARPVYRHGSLYATRSVALTEGSDIVAAPVWLEVDLSNWPAARAVQAGVLREAGEWNSFPSLMVDSAKRVAVVFNSVSRTHFASLDVVSRVPGDAAGALALHETVKAGSTALLSGPGPTTIGARGVQSFAVRTSAALDPADDSIWIIGQYAGDPVRWLTWVARLS